MTATISRRIPPQRLINMINPLVRRILASPLHGALDKSLLILHVTGRRTGRRYDIPVGYVNLGQQLVVITQHTWRANLRGQDHVEVTYRGHRQPMAARLDEDEQATASILHRIFEHVGTKAAQRQLGLKTDGKPTLAALADAVHEFHLSTLTLTAPTDTTNGSPDNQTEATSSGRAAQPYTTQPKTTH
jgi:deazaflavin-dependent oxidoreductase (nitroreductase family)